MSVPHFLAFSVLLGCLAPPVRAQNTLAAQAGSAAVQQARREGVPERIGAWRLVRHSRGEHPQFLYASGSRSFSLFVTETNSTQPLKAQKGWKPTRLDAETIAFLHKDARDPALTAIVFKHRRQRQILLGKLSDAELLSLAKQLLARTK